MSALTDSSCSGVYNISRATTCDNYRRVRRRAETEGEINVLATLTRQVR